jgi:lamin tail-like protein/CotH protein
VQSEGEKKMLRMVKVSLVFFLSVGLFYLSEIQAQSIAINSSDTGNADTLMSLTDVAGVVPQANWNDLGGQSGTNLALVDDSGAGTGATVTWTSNNTWRTDIDQTVSGDYRMMKGYLDYLDNPVTPIQVTINNIPYATYDLYVYFDGDGGDIRNGFHDVRNPTTSAVIAGPIYHQDPAATHFSGTYIQVPSTSNTDQGVDTPEGNYKIFEGLTAASILLYGEGATFRVQTNGIQIVSTNPPPSAINPDPHDEAERVNPNYTLTWEVDGEDPDPPYTYNFYFGTDPANWDIEVTDWFTASYSPPMDYMTTYHWQVEVVEDGQTSLDPVVWTLTTGGKATNPIPSLGEGNVSVPTTDLYWTGDSFATSYKVYGGEEFPLSYLGEVTEPEFLDFPTPKLSTTYHWRVDEYVNGNPTVAGDNWSFTTVDTPTLCLYGDLNGDCFVNLVDLMLFCRQWPDNPGGIANMDGAGGVDLGDYNLLAGNWLKTVAPPMGAMLITLEPEAAIAAGAQWRYEGGDWRNSGYLEPNLPVGSYVLQYKDVTGWKAPADEPVEVYDDLITTRYGNYTLPVGSLQVVIDPSAARDDGAQWRVDAGVWRNSHFTDTGLTAGYHNVEFKTIDNWFKPTNQFIEIQEGQTTPVTGTYIPQTGSLRVTIEPQIVQGEGRWRVVGDDGTWHEGGYRQTGLTPGTHILEFKEIPDWSRPGNQIVDIIKDITVDTSGTYYSLEGGSVEVTIEPQGARDNGAQWRIDGGVWHDSGETQSFLSPGPHVVDFTTVAGWITPFPDTINVNDGQTSYYTGTYFEEELLRVVINEIHYDPDVKTELAEFVELYNAGASSVDISQWYFDDGLTYSFPPGTPLLLPGEYVIVAYDPTVVQNKYGVTASKIYGPFTGSLDNDGETIGISNAVGEPMDRVDYQLGFPWPTVGDPVPDDGLHLGSGHSIQLLNPYLDNDLSGSWRSAYPTPAARNLDVYAGNIPPHIRQVNHTPKQPVSGEVVKITAKVTDPDGVANVILHTQLVNPGSYINITDAAYQTNWSNLTMHDDGLNGDEFAGDDIYTVEMAAGFQTHRRLVRYRITIVDAGARSVTVPYTDDPQPNFAYFVYDGVPAWQGAIEPGGAPVIEYGTEVMNSLPVYHLISKKSDVEANTWLEKYGGREFKWRGTLVYDGEVYDHVHYRTRGGVWRYAMGKNMWKFDFNRGHYFQARDDYGKKYNMTWDKLNFSACIQQGSFGQRGEQGMFEALSFKMFNLAGVPAPKTNWLQFRIIDELYENGTGNAAHPPLTYSGTQFDGDFWGLYMTVEQMDGRFLDEHDLPDGNLYKMEATYGELNNQGPTAVTDSSDIKYFKDTYESSPSSDWWGDHMDLRCYYGYYAIYQAVRHGDITYKNHFFYLNPELTTNEWGTNYLWQQLPWDVDLTWTTYYGSTTPSDPFSRSGVLNHAVINLENKNRLREINDLLFHPEQMNTLIDELAAVIDKPEPALSMVDADRAMWDYHWVMGSGAYPTYLSRPAYEKAGQGKFYQEAVDRGYSRTFEGMVQVMKDYVIERMGHMATLCYDWAIPATPQISYIGGLDYPENDLRFQTSAFSDPQGSGTFAALKWRIAEVTDDANPIYTPDEERNYEITPTWESAEIAPFVGSIQIPADGIKVGHTYRVRCRMKDTTGRWSHWSNAIQFVVGEPIPGEILTDLRITELMYNPATPTPAEVAAGFIDKDDFEFIELKNTGTTTLDLSNVSFTNGFDVDYVFAGSNVTSLGAGDFVLVVKNQNAFEERYGTSLSSKIAGEYIGGLKNSGEEIKLEDYLNGTIVQFEYNDNRGWPLPADGCGHSLVPLDTALPEARSGSLDYGPNWRASTYMHGSPAANDPVRVDSVVINEIRANTAANDWIELYNTAGSTANLDSDWYLSDDHENLKKWPLSTVSISGYNFRSFDQISDFLEPIDETNPDFEGILLSYLPGNATDRVVDSVRLKAQESTTSLGRYLDGRTYWYPMVPSRDTNNTTPVLDVVIQEIMYHPLEGTENEEYIELYNPPTGGSISLDDWRLNGDGWNYEFPVGLSIPTGETLIVVDFDPYVETQRLNDFETVYGTGNLTAGVDIIGENWGGNLSNGGERIALERPQALGWYIVDEVIYFDQAPWPTGPDGTGAALHRLTAAGHGNDPTNWQADSPSPGS